MPLIGPPNEYDKPVPESVEPSKLTDYEQDRRIQLILNLNPWICSSCGGVNSYLTKLCCGRHKKSNPCYGVRPANHSKVRK